MRLRGPWRQIQVALWLVGLAILAWKGWWWPGILVLVALSAILQAVIQYITFDYSDDVIGAAGLASGSGADNQGWLFILKVFFFQYAMAEPSELINC